MKAPKKMKKKLPHPRSSLLLLVLGISLILIGITLMLVTSMLYGAGSVNFGAIIFIGPIPIVIGAGPEGGSMVLFSIIIAVLSVIIFTMLRRRNRHVDS